MNSDLAYAGLGPCEDYEFDLVEGIDGALAPGRADAVRRHLAGCARCRAFERQIREVDVSLAAALPRPQLSADFDARLRERIGPASRSFARDAARAQVEEEYRTSLQSLRRHLTWGTALNALGAAGVGGALAFALGSLTPAVFQSLHALGPLPATIGFYVAGVAVAAGFAAPFMMRRGPSPLFG